MDFDDSSRQPQKKSHKFSTGHHSLRDPSQRHRKLRFVGTSSTLPSYLKNKDIEFKKKYGTPGNFIISGQLPHPTRSTIQELYQKALQEERDLHYAIHSDNAFLMDDHSEATTEPEIDEENVVDEDNADNVAPEAHEDVIIEQGPPVAPVAPLPEFQLSPEVLKRLRKRIRELVKSEDERTEKIIKEWTEKWVQMYGELWDDCEYAVQHACETDPKYKQVSKELNPLKLVQIFNRRAIAPESISQNKIYSAEIKKRYEDTHQGGMSIALYYETFVNRMNHSIAAGNSMEPESESAMRFLGGLHSSSMKLKIALKNGTATIPTTLREAYSLALSWNVAEVRVRGDRHFDSAITDIAMPAIRSTKRVKKIKGQASLPATNHTIPVTDDTLQPLKSAPHASRGASQASRGGSLLPPNPCRHCGGPHWNRECPKRPRPAGNTSHPTQISVPAMLSFDSLNGEITLISNQSLKIHEIAPDTVSSVNIVRDSGFAKNIRDAKKPIRLLGIGGVTICDKVCDFHPFGEAYYLPDGPGNILSLGLLKDIGFTWTKDTLTDHLKISNQDGSFTMFFTKASDRNIYVTYAPELAYLDEHLAAPVLQTVHERLAAFSSKEVKRIEEARSLARSLMFIPAAKIIGMLRRGKINYTKVTVQDMMNYVKVYPHEVAHIKGTSIRTVRGAPRPISQDVLERLVTPDSIDLSADIMFVHRKFMFMITISEPGNHLMATVLRTTQGSELKIVLDAHRAKYAAYGFKVVRIICDNESGLRANSSLLELSILQVDFVGYDTHVAKVERAIQTIKGAVRTVHHALPFKLPDFLFPWLVQYCVSRINMIPTKALGNDITPREYITGKQIHAIKELGIGFGELVEIPVKSTNRVTDARTRTAIALLCTGNAQYTWIFLNLETNRIVRSDVWRAVPHNSLSINALNELATGTNYESIPFDAIYHMGSLSREVTDIEFNNEAIVTKMEDTGDSPLSGKHDNTTAFDDNLSIVEHSPIIDFIPNDETYAHPQPTDSSDVIENMLPIGSYNVSPPTILSSNYGSEDSDSDYDPPTDSDIDENESDDDIDLPELAGDEEDEYVVQTTRPTDRYDLRTSIRRPARFRDGTSLTTAIDMGSESDLVTEAINNEIDILITKDVFDPVDPSTLISRQLRSTIPSKMFVKLVLNPDGTVKKTKARFVGGGHRQDRSLYQPSDTSSPTISLTALNVLLSIVAMESRKVYTIDVTGAYLNAEIQKELYIRIPQEVSTHLIKRYPRFAIGLDGTGKIYARLKKALYGTIEASVLWYLLLMEILVQIGFVPNTKEPCVVNMIRDHCQITVGVYVDDLLCTSKSAENLIWLADNLQSAFEGITIHSGTKHNFLGRTIEFCDDGIATITMEKHITSFLDKLTISGFSAYPATTTLFDIDASSPHLDPVKKALFHSTVALLRYIADCARPDLHPVPSFLASRVLCPTDQDWKKLIKCAKYLHSTKHLHLTLRPSAGVLLVAYVDAAFGVYHSTDYRSTTGAALQLNGNTVWTKSTKQKLNAKSSTEAELIAVSDALPHILWTRDFIIAQGYSVPATTLFQDNLSTITMIHNGRGTSPQTRYIAVRFFWVKDRVDSGEILIEHVPTEAMLADLLTKPLQGAAFHRLRAALLGLPLDG